MSDCRQIESLLPPYVDGEADREAVAGVDVHLSTCATCRARVSAERTARAVVRARAAQLATVAPPGLRTRLVAALHPPEVRRLGWRGRLTAFAAAAALVLALLTGFEFVSLRSNVLFAAQLAIDHVRCFVVELGSIDGTDAAVVRQEYQRLYGWDVDVPPSSAEHGLTLVAARRCPFWIGQHAHLLYRMGANEVSLYVTRGAGRPAEDLSVLAHVQQIWSAHGDVYTLVSRGVPSDQLTRVTRYLRAQTND